MKAFITGVTGQTGSYLAEHLLSLGYEVYGLVRRTSEPNYFRLRAVLDNPKFHICPGDLTDAFSLSSLILDIRPNEIYNLAAQSHVWESFKQPQYTIDTIVNGTLNILESAKQLEKLGHKTKVYLSSSSEMWGSNTSLIYSNGERTEINFKEAPEILELIKTDVTYKELWTCVQDENTPFAPNSPYAVAKLAAHNLGRIYRDSYGMFVTQAVLHNHESPRRGSQFVTQKIINYIVRLESWLLTQKKNERQHYYDFNFPNNMISLVRQNPNNEPYGHKDSWLFGCKFPKLELGDVSAYRDWGHAKEYAEAQHLIMQHLEPEDFVIGTGEAHSVEEFLDYAFNLIDMNYTDCVVFNKSLFRPNEVPFLQADPGKAKRVLNWEAKTKFHRLIEIMYESEKKNLQNKN